MGYLGMTLLAAKGAFNLERLHINCSLGYFHSWAWRNSNRAQPLPKRVARKVYRDCYPWLEAVGVHRATNPEGELNEMHAGIDILEINERNFGPDTVSEKEREETHREYRKELRKLVRFAM